MDLESLIIESVQLLLIGMGTVFIILIMLIFLINTMTKLLPEEVIEQPVSRSRPVTTVTATQPNNNALIAVISAAINKYKKSNSSL